MIINLRATQRQLAREDTEDLTLAEMKPREHMESRHRGLMLWLTGPPAAGKSTLAGALSTIFAGLGKRVEILDGDEVRAALSNDLGFSRADRATHIRRIGFIAGLLSRHNVTVIIAAVSPYRDVRDELRAMYPDRFVEVHVDCPIDELLRRDPKGLYARAIRGELPDFTGVSDPYEFPLSPEIHVRTDLLSVRQSCALVLKCLDERQLLC